MNEAAADFDASMPVVAEDEGALKRSRNYRGLLYLVVFSPVLALGVAVAMFAVDMPVWDDWERGEMWRRHSEGKLDFEYLYSPHIEHRSLFPRLITLAYGKWFGGDIRAEIWTIYAIVAATCLLIFRLLRYTLSRGPPLWVATFLINLLICCPQQYSNFSWASMVAFMIPIFCLAAILVVSISRMPIWAKFLVMLLLAELGTHSFSQGLVLWPVAICLPLFLPAHFGGLRQRLLFAGGMSLLAALTIYPYFNWNFVTTSHFSHTYGTQTGERSTSFERLKKVLANKKRTQDYFFKALGNPVTRAFTQKPRADTRDVGRVIFVLFLASLGFLFWRRRDAVTWNRLIPWYAAACFAVSVAALLAFARAGAHTDRSVMPRYIPMTIYLFVALIAIGAYVVRWWAASAPNRRAASRRASWGAGAAGALAVLLGGLWVYGLFKMAAWRDARLEARAELSYILLFEPEKGGRIDGAIEFYRPQAVLMSKLGLLHSPVVDAWGFEPFRPNGDKLDGDHAVLRRSSTMGGNLSVSGFALLPGRRTADGVLVSVRTSPDAKWRVIGFAEMRASHIPKNIFLDGHFGDGPEYLEPHQYAAFEGLAELPPDAGGEGAQLLCWALDARTNRAYPIGEATPINLPSP